MATRQTYQITGWRDSSNTAGGSGLGRKAEWPLRSGTPPASGQQLPAPAAWVWPQTCAARLRGSGPCPRPLAGLEEDEGERCI